jgi:hypothetical protein
MPSAAAAGILITFRFFLYLFFLYLFFLRASRLFQKPLLQSRSLKTCPQDLSFAQISSLQPIRETKGLRKRPLVSQTSQEKRFAQRQNPPSPPCSGQKVGILSISPNATLESPHRVWINVNSNLQPAGNQSPAAQHHPATSQTGNQMAPSQTHHSYIQLIGRRIPSLSRPAKAHQSHLW